MLQSENINPTTVLGYACGKKWILAHDSCVLFVRMATNLNARIDQLDDLDDAWDLLDELKIDTSGVADLDEAKKRLRVHANSNKESRLALPVRQRHLVPLILFTVCSTSAWSSL